MLVLTRKLEQKVFIGPHISVKVLSIQGDRVKLGIEAPAELLVLRDELISNGVEPND